MSQNNNCLFQDASNREFRKKLSYAEPDELLKWLGNSEFLVVEEGQHFPELKMHLTRVMEILPEIRILVAESAQFNPQTEYSEKFSNLKLFPLSWVELEKTVEYESGNTALEQRLIFGMYPGVIQNKGYEKEELAKIISRDLLKDILDLSGIRKPDELERLLRILALKIGEEITFNDLGRMIEVDKNTVIHYLDLLEKSFVIFRLDALSRNFSNEVSDCRKYYFYDTGIRNAIILNFNSREFRQDWDALWENFLIAEKIKSNAYKAIWADSFFWRTYQKQSIDYLEETTAGINAWKFKWKQLKKEKFPLSFKNAYPGTVFEVLTQENFRSFLGMD